MADNDDSMDISSRLEYALANMTDMELVRLYRSVQYSLIGGTTYNDPKELFNEAIYRTLDGRRSWPSSESFGTYIWMVMRSIANADRKMEAQSIELLANDQPVFDGFSLIGDQLAEYGSVELAVDQVLEDALVHKRILEDLQTIEDHFRNDQNVTLVIMAIEDNVPPRELESDYGLSITQYESARKKLRRYIDLQFPGRRRTV
ncbi:MAG: hypothetical protein V4495_19920 [Pseudomonadota bacterium]